MQIMQLTKPIAIRIAVSGRKTRLVALLCFVVAAGGHSFVAQSAASGVRDDQTASEFRSAGQPDDASAQLRLGQKLQREGKIEEAQDLYVQAAQAGLGEAHAAFLHSFTTMEQPRALASLEKHARAGYNYAQHRYALAMRVCGKGFSWLESAAKGGWPESQFLLGQMYRHDSAALCKGIKRDPELALKWHRTAAQNETVVPHPGQHVRFRAHGEIAELYLREIDIGQKYEEAFKWALVGAENEDKKSARIVADLYAKGLGVEKDLAKADYWKARGVIRVFH